MVIHQLFRASNVIVHKFVGHPVNCIQLLQYHAAFFQETSEEKTDELKFQKKNPIDNIQEKSLVHVHLMPSFHGHVVPIGKELIKIFSYQLELFLRHFSFMRYSRPVKRSLSTVLARK